MNAVENDPEELAEPEQTNPEQAVLVQIGPEQAVPVKINPEKAVPVQIGPELTSLEQAVDPEQEQDAS